MAEKVWLRILSAVVVVGAIAAIAYLAFGAGVAQGAGSGLSAAAPGQSIAYGAPYFWHPFAFLGFGCLGPLFALFLIFIALRAVSFLFWGPRWAHWGHVRHGWRHGWDEEGGVPARFREWHDRAHGSTQPNKDDVR
jgi:hypothetical protein